MYRLIIADDEKVILKGLRDYIDWKEMGFQVVETFEDGKEALEYIKSNLVDVVLSDIEMAEVSGLELARYISEQKTGHKVVIVSSYKEFEYARKAVEYGVEYYLLKPIHIGEVKDVFHKIAKELEEEKKNDWKTELLPQLQEEFWAELLAGVFLNRDNIEKRKQVLQIGINVEHPFAVADVQIEQKEEKFFDYFEGENYHNLIRNIFCETTGDISAFPIFLSDEVIKVILTSVEMECTGIFEQKVQEKLDEKCSTAEKLLKLKLKCQVEKVAPDIMGISDYRYKVKVHTGEDREDHVCEQELESEDYERLIQKYKLLMGIINDGKFEELDNLLEHIFMGFHEMPVAQVQKLCIDLFSMISTKLLRIGIDMWMVWNKKVHYRELMEIQNVHDLEEKVRELLYEITNTVKEKQNIRSRQFVEESIRYMKEHYAEDISLESIANKFFLNQTYFSRLFKQCTGSTFTDYLIELRMEKAKELLKTGKYKVYEISAKVGYHSEKYFFRIFKQYTGCSPTEYYRGNRINE